MTGRERGGGGCNGNTGEGVVGWGREMMQKMRGNEKSEEMEMQMVNKKTCHDIQARFGNDMKDASTQSKACSVN